jgi:Tol biopolymer transport system component
MRRVTYNTFARDIDPAWSPDGQSIIFETDRDGNWELYLFSLATGAETRLTDDASSDVNAFWTPDSQHVVFQSDRSGMWQLYILSIATAEVTLLSDGTTQDHDGHVSFKGDKIAFCAYELGSNKSGIYIMNIDGTDKHLVGR